MTQALLPSPCDDDRRFYDMAYGRHALPMAAFAQERGLFVCLEGGPRAFDEIEAETGTSGRVTETMLAVATAMGFLERSLPDAWRLSEYGRTYLVSSSPFYRGPLTSADHPDLAELRRACLEEQGPTRPLAVAIEDLPEAEVRQFIERMHAITLPAASALARNEIFASVDRLLDVADRASAIAHIRGW